MGSRMKNQRLSIQGFTLVELLIALTIVAILAAAAILYMRGQLFKANDARRKADLEKIRVAVEEYEKDHNCYPPPELMTCNPGTGLKPYLDKIPCDPVTGNSYVYEYDTAKTCSDWFRLFANFQNFTDLPDSGYRDLSGNSVYCISSPNALSCRYVNLKDYYACVSGSCVPINFNRSINKYECANKFSSSNCNNQCRNPINECRRTQ